MGLLGWPLRTVVYGEGHFADSVDTISHDGQTYMGPHVTIWRWREAFQNDFAARMQWGVQTDFTSGKHAPVAVINGDESRNVIKITAKGSEEVVLDASSSCNPDAGSLQYKWWQYLEPSSNNNGPWRDVGHLELDAADQAKVTVKIPSLEVLRKEGRNAHPEADKHLHLILEVSDGELVSYRRIIFTVLGPESEAAGGHDEL